MIQTTDPFLLFFLVAILIFSAVNDYRFQKIPNRFTFPAMLVSLTYHLVTNGPGGLLFSVSGLAAGIALLIIPYLMGKMGAGDAKLMGAVGAVLGTKGVVISFLYTAICGGVYALLLTVVHREHFRGFYRKQFITLQTLILTKRYIPDPEVKGRPKLCYGIAIALGTFIHLGLAMAGHDLLNF